MTLPVKNDTRRQRRYRMIALAAFSIAAGALVMLLAGCVSAVKPTPVQTAAFAVGQGAFVASSVADWDQTRRFVIEGEIGEANPVQRFVIREYGRTGFTAGQAALTAGLVAGLSWAFTRAERPWERWLVIGLSLAAGAVRTGVVLHNNAVLQDRSVCRPGC